MRDVLYTQIDEQLDERFDGAREVAERVISNIVRELYGHWYINSERVVTDALKSRLLSIVTGEKDDENAVYDYTFDAARLVAYMADIDGASLQDLLRSELKGFMGIGNIKFNVSLQLSENLEKKISEAKRRLLPDEAINRIEDSVYHSLFWDYDAYRFEGSEEYDELVERLAEEGEEYDTDYLEDEPEYHTWRERIIEEHGNYAVGDALYDVLRSINEDLNSDEYFLDGLIEEGLVSNYAFSPELEDQIKKGKVLEALKDFTFTVEIDVYVKQDAQSVAEIAEVLNRFYTVLETVVTRSLTPLRATTDQYNLFTGELDVYDLGALVRIEPKFTVHMNEAVDTVTGLKSKVARTLISKLNTRIDTVYNVIVFNKSRKPENLDIRLNKSPSVLRLLLDEGISVSLSKVGKDTKIEVASNALYLREDLILIVPEEYSGRPEAFETSLRGNWRGVPSLSAMMLKGKLAQLVFGGPTSTKKLTDSFTKVFYDPTLDTFTDRYGILDSYYFVGTVDYLTYEQDRDRDTIDRTPDLMRRMSSVTAKRKSVTVLKAYDNQILDLRAVKDVTVRELAQGCVLGSFGRYFEGCDALLIGVVGYSELGGVFNEIPREMDVILVDQRGSKEDLLVLTTTVKPRSVFSTTQTLLCNLYTNSYAVLSSMEEHRAVLSVAFNTPLYDCLNSYPAAVGQGYLQQETLSVRESKIINKASLSPPFLDQEKVSFTSLAEAESVLGRVGYSEFKQRLTSSALSIFSASENLEKFEVLKLLGLASMSSEVVLSYGMLYDERTTRIVGGEREPQFRVEVVDASYKIAKNVNLLACANLAIFVPQMIARFREHLQPNTSINNAPLGAAMDATFGGEVNSPYDYFADPINGIYSKLLRRNNYVGAGSIGYFNAEQRINGTTLSPYMGAIRYIYSFVDFYTKPLALLYNVLLNPKQYGLRENPYIRGSENLAATYSIKPASSWVSVYREALKLSQRDVSWSYLMTLDEVPTKKDVEFELSQFQLHASVFEYDDLFKEDGSSKFETFTLEASYRDQSILPVDLRNQELHTLFKNALAPFKYSVYFDYDSANRECTFEDMHGKYTYDVFSRKLNSCVYIFASHWSFNIAPLITQQFYDGSFYRDNLEGSNPNVLHVADLKDIFKYGVYSTGIKKIIQNNSVSVGDGEKSKFCEANYEKNRIPYYPIHYALKMFPRIQGSVFGPLPNEQMSTVTSSERLSLGAYISTTNFIVASYRIMGREVSVDEFGPQVVAVTSTENAEVSIRQQTGFSVVGERVLESVNSPNVSNGGATVESRLSELTRNYNICTGQSSQRYTGRAQRGSADVFSCFVPKNGNMFACIYYENGRLFEIKAEENCVIGATPESGTKLFRYGRSGGAQAIVRNIDLFNVQVVFNFLVFLNAYDPSKYGFKASDDDFAVCASAFLGSFDALCIRKGIKKIDHLPRKFVDVFARSFVLFKDPYYGKSDYITRLREMYDEWRVDEYLPSLFFTEMRYLLDRDWDDNEMRSYFNTNAYFGVIPPKEAIGLKFPSNDQIVDILDELIRVEDFISNPSISEMITSCGSACALPVKS